MIPEWQTLARRAVACPRWRWLPGMRWVHIQIPRRGEGPSSARVRDRRPRHGKDVPVTVLPDLTDPATLGCLVALVREAWSGLVVISLGAGWWSVQTDFKDWDQDNTKSFVDALVSALERA